jgi:2-polyprenyl-3-methyl-5-hydroxy-6-metoxy-1,4-benzoquinol methylase
MADQTSAKSDAALQRELEYQREWAQRSSITATPANVMERYRSLKYAGIIQKDFMYRELGPLKGKTLLDFGCGEGQVATQLAMLGADVTGIDISPELIQLAQRRAELDHVGDRSHFLVCDLLKEPFPKNHFDLIMCSAVLHHVNHTAVLLGLRECLKPGGRIVIGEPIAPSPLLRALRKKVWFLPVDALPDEKQFDQSEIDSIADTFKDSRIVYFNCLSRLMRILPGSAYRLEDAPTLVRWAVVVLMAVDRPLAAAPFLRRFFGAVTIVGSK